MWWPNQRGNESIPVLGSVRQRNNDVLVDENEQRQQEAEAHGADDVQGRQTLEWRHVKDGPVVNFNHWNCSEKGQKCELKRGVYVGFTVDLRQFVSESFPV